MVRQAKMAYAPILNCSKIPHTSCGYYQAALTFNKKEIVCFKAIRNQNGNIPLLKTKVMCNRYRYYCAGNALFCETQ
jgi:hypothetical protein